MMVKTEVIDAVVFSTGTALKETQEFTLGMREMRKRLPGIRRWYNISQNTIAAADFPNWSDAPWMLVILNSAILISDNLLDELIAVTNGDAMCALPADPRNFTPDAKLDYASRPGFDRFVARLAGGPRLGDYDSREPWIYLVERTALAKLSTIHEDLTWGSVPALLGVHTVTAHHAFVHSYADYHLNTRSEMLHLLPHNTRTLLDVGGGNGNFARVFMTERGGQATLLEFNPSAAEIARERGIEVITGDFASVAATRLFDCVAMLDVLEHMLDPLAALVHARQFLQPGGALLLSVPNIGHWSVVWDLLEGKFDYQPVGILCNTHLRFFTRHGLEALIADAGFQVERWENMPSPSPEPFAGFLKEHHTTPGVMPDLESLATESFHILARRD